MGGCHGCLRIDEGKERSCRSHDLPYAVFLDMIPLPYVDIDSRSMLLHITHPIHAVGEGGVTQSPLMQDAHYCLTAQLQQQSVNRP